MIETLKHWGVPDWYLESPSFVKSILLMSHLYENSDEGFRYCLERFLHNTSGGSDPIHKITLNEVNYCSALKVAKERCIKIEED